MTENWILEAIEEKAYQRAVERITTDGGFQVYGLSASQIAWLIGWYEHKTGTEAKAIDPSGPINID